MLVLPTVPPSPPGLAEWTVVNVTSPTTAYTRAGQVTQTSHWTGWPTTNQRVFLKNLNWDIKTRLLLFGWCWDLELGLELAHGNSKIHWELFIRRTFQRIQVCREESGTERLRDEKKKEGFWVPLQAPWDQLALLGMRICALCRGLYISKLSGFLILMIELFLKIACPNLPEIFFRIKSDNECERAQWPGRN